MQQVSELKSAERDPARVRKRFRQQLETVVPFGERRTCTVEEAIRAVPISRSKLYQLIREGVVQKLKIGTMTRILIASLPGHGETA
jgi:hypothetical protein